MFKQKVKPTEAHNNIVFLECSHLLTTANKHKKMKRKPHIQKSENREYVRSFCEYENVLENYDCFILTHDFYLWLKHESNNK